jgi:hypothetical protein
MRAFLRRYRWLLLILWLGMAAMICNSWFSQIGTPLSARMYSRIELGMSREGIKKIINWPTAPSSLMDRFWSDIELHEWRLVEEQNSPAGSPERLAPADDSATWLDSRLAIRVAFRHGQVIWKARHAPAPKWKGGLAAWKDRVLRLIGI